MNENISEIAVVADRSGSMDGMIDEARNSINRLIEEQREVDGYANFTFCMFDDEYEVLHDRQDIRAVGLIGHNYSARGMTAMYDAIGKTINTIQQGIDKTPAEKKPGKVILAIVTDGEENASQEYTAQQVAELIEKKKADGWKFLFFGANIDAWSTARAINISHDDTVCYAATNDGISDTYSGMSTSFTSHRTGG